MNQKTTKIFANPKVRSTTLLLLLLLLVAISYSNSLYSPFVLDDMHSFVNNKDAYVTDFSLSSLRQLGNTVFGKRRWLPMISFAVDNHLANGSIVQYHLTNISIHLLTTVALFFFIKGLLLSIAGSKSLKFISPTGFALMVTALWSLNPVQTNAVTYLVQRMTSMAALFFLSSLTCYTFARLTPHKKRRAGLFLGAGISALCAFMSKENTATLPVAMLFIEYFFLSPGRLEEIIKKKLKTLTWYHYTGLVILVLILLPLAEASWHRWTAGYEIRYFSLPERLLTELRVMSFYLSLLLFPLPGRLNLEHDFSVSTSLFAPPTTFFSLLLLISLIVLSFKIRKSQPLASFGIVWFFLNLIIESSFIPLELIFEHRLYLPSVGFFISILSLFDMGLARLVPRESHPDIKKIIICFAILILSLSSVLTTFRNNDWRDAISFYRDCANKSPALARPHNSLGTALVREGKYEEALSVLEKTIMLGRPRQEEYINAASNSLMALAKMGKYEEAIEKGENYIRQAPELIDLGGQPKLLHNLGILYKYTGQYQFAFEALTGSLTAKGRHYFTTIDTIQEMEDLLANNYENEEARNALGMYLEKDGVKTAVRLRMARLMLDIKDYQKAQSYLEVLKVLSPINERAAELRKTLVQETEKNKAQAYRSDINNHPPYNNNFRIRLYLDTADFILKYYSPLTVFAGRLIEKAKALAPADPFVALYWCRYLEKTDQSGQFVNALQCAVEKFPDFIPLLQYQADNLTKLGKLERLAAILKHILDIYPGHKNWHIYQKIINEYGKKDTVRV